MRRITLLPALLLALLLGATAARADSGVKLTFSGVSDASISSTANASGTYDVSGLTVTVTDLSTNETASGVSATLDAVSFTKFQTGDSAKAHNLIGPASGSGYDNQRGSTISYTFTVTGLTSLVSKINAASVGVCLLQGGGGFQGADVGRNWTATIGDIGSASKKPASGKASGKQGADVYGMYNLNLFNVKNTDGITPTDSYTFTVTLTKDVADGCYAAIQDVELIEVNDPDDTFDFHSTLSNTSNTFTSTVTETPADATVATAGNFTLTVENSTNNISTTGKGRNSYYLGLYYNTNAGTYTITAPDGYNLTSYTITGYADTCDVTVTAADGSSQRFLPNGTDQTFSVSSLSAQSTTFTLSGTNNTSLLAKIAFTYEKESTYEHPDDTFDFTSTMESSVSGSSYYYKVTETAAADGVGDFTLAEASNSNNIEKTGQGSDGYFLGLNIGGYQSLSTYEIKAPTGYVITGYTITGFARQSTDVTITPTDGTTATFTSSGGESQTLTVSGLTAHSTQFTLSTSATKGTGVIVGIGAKIKFYYTTAPTSHTVTIPATGYTTFVSSDPVAVPYHSYSYSPSTGTIVGVSCPSSFMIYSGVAASSADATGAVAVTSPYYTSGDNSGYAYYEIPANTPVLLGGPAGTYSLTVLSSTSQSFSSGLSYASEATTLDGPVWVLDETTGTFKKKENYEIAANGVYYQPNSTDGLADELKLTEAYFCQKTSDNGGDGNTLWYRVTSTDETNATGVAEICNPDRYKKKTETLEGYNYTTDLIPYWESTSYALPTSVTFNGVTYNVTTVGENAFANAQGVTSITLPEGYTTIKYTGLSNTGISTIDLPSTLTSLGTSAFSLSQQLTEIDIPGSVTEIGKTAFANSALQTVVMNEGTTTIDQGAFSTCAQLTSLTLPEGLKTIGQEAFSNALGYYLTTSLYPNGSVSEEFLSAFLEKQGLTLDDIEALESNYGWYTYKSSGAYVVVANIADLTIPASVETIGLYAFQSAVLDFLRMESRTPCTMSDYSPVYTSTNLQVIVPTDCSQYYKTNASSTGWNYYTSNIREEVNIRKPKWDDDYGAKHYATLSLSEPFTVPAGLTAGIPYAASNGALSIDWFGTEGTVVKANTPVILYGTSSTTPFYYVATTEADATDATAGGHESDNMLKGYTDYDENTTYTTIDPETATSGKKVYVMTYGEEYKSDGLGNVTTEVGENKYDFGFYWDANTKDKGYTARCPRYKAVLISDVAATGPTAPSTSSVRGKARAAAATTEGKGFPLTYEEQRVSQDVTLGTTGYATLYHRYALVVPQGITASTVTADGDQLTLNAEYQSGDILPAYTPVVLQGEPGTYTFTFTVGGTRPAANDLHGTTKDSLLTGEGKYYKLSLSKDGQNVGFYYGGYQGRGFFNAGGKAYLYVNPATASTRGYALDEATTTAISSALTEDGDAQAGATRNGAATYDLQGRRVAQPARGLYIMGGKKVIIR